ncbi:MAG: methylmalonyl-CoA mutase family protein, partial [Balneolaceae bacterium]|nr:methylmalonyl-CoA mutase family protein [Balneolaceae bacterium]
MEQTPYKSTHKIRLVTAASLFDGHDASINIMRRILQSSGAEVIHLGHNRSVKEIVDCAIQEDVQGIAISSYQGGHMEFFTYMIELLAEQGAGHIKVFGGGGGVIVDDEIAQLHAAGVSRIFSVADGAAMGLQGMINHILEQCDFDVTALEAPADHEVVKLARAITKAELDVQTASTKGEKASISGNKTPLDQIPVLGITGTGGAGKSSLTDELIRRFLSECPDLRIGVISIDPSKVKTGGALLGDRIRMNAIQTDRVYMRSLATRASDTTISPAVKAAIRLVKEAGYNLVIVETSGIGQSGAEILQVADVPVYVMTQEFGAATQLEKINMLDLAEFVVLNKFEKKGSLDALRDVRKQMQRNRGEWHAELSSMPVYPTIAAQFNDEGVNRLFAALTEHLAASYGESFKQERFTNTQPVEEITSTTIMPGSRERYLSEIADTVREYHAWADKQIDLATRLDQVTGTIAQFQEQKDAPSRDQSTAQTAQSTALQPLLDLQKSLRERLDYYCQRILDDWDDLKKVYEAEEFVMTVRDKEIRQPMYRETLSGLKIPRLALPKTQNFGERLKFALKENMPGYYPFTAGVFKLKREGEDPTRMFAGEGTPDRTNKRFHYLSEGMPAARLSTAFDSVTLYGEDPDPRPDIYGKVGNSGVSICTLEDMKKLYAGFDLCDPTTSVSMTINGPAPMILAMFLNTAIDQQLDKKAKELGLKSREDLPSDVAADVRAWTLSTVRGTV